MTNVAVISLSGEIPYNGKAGHVIRLLEKGGVKGVWGHGKKFHAFNDRLQVFFMKDYGLNRRIFFKDTEGHAVSFKCDSKKKTFIPDSADFDMDEGIIRAIFVMIDKSQYTGTTVVELGDHSWDIPPVLKFESPAHCYIYQKLVPERMVSTAEILPELIGGKDEFEIAAGKEVKVLFNGETETIGIGDRLSTRLSIHADSKAAGEDCQGPRVYEDEDYVYRQLMEHCVYPISPLTAIFVQGIPKGENASSDQTESIKETIAEPTVTEQLPIPVSDEPPVYRWVPHENQFVRINGELNNELYFICGFNHKTMEFTLAMADSARARRELDMKDMSVGARDFYHHSKPELFLKVVDCVDVRPVILGGDMPWVPQMGQYVEVVEGCGLDSTVKWNLYDYDSYLDRFIVRMADCSDSTKDVRKSIFGRVTGSEVTPLSIDID